MSDKVRKDDVLRAI